MIYLRTKTALLAGISLLLAACGSQSTQPSSVTADSASAQAIQLAPQPTATGHYPTARNGDVLLGNPNYQAISYGAFRTKSRSNENSPSVAELKEDLRLMQAMGIKLLRTYNTQIYKDTATLLVAIDELMASDPDFEMYVMLGIWIDALNAWTDKPVIHDQESPRNQLEMAKAVEMVQAYPEIIKVLAVGNEAMVHWAPYHVSPGIILGHVKQLQSLKAAGEIPADVWVTSSDNWAPWSGSGDYANPDLDALVQAVDYVSMHTYAFHDTHYNNEFWLSPENQPGLSRMERVDLAMQRAYQHSISQVRSVQGFVNRIAPGKQIHIGETGWSSYTNTLYGDEGSKAADEYKQKVFHDALRSWSDSFGASLFFFQAFDEPWKGDASNPGDSEQHFGLIDIQGNAKYLLWEMVDAGAFNGLTRGGNTIVKSHGGDEQKVLDKVLAPNPAN